MRQTRGRRDALLAVSVASVAVASVAVASVAVATAAVATAAVAMVAVAMMALTGGAVLALLPVLVLVRRRPLRRARMVGVDYEVAVAKMGFDRVLVDDDLHPRVLRRMRAVADRHLVRVLVRCRRAESERSQTREARGRERGDHGRRHDRDPGKAHRPADRDLVHLLGPPTVDTCRQVDALCGRSLRTAQRPVDSLCPSGFSRRACASASVRALPRATSARSAQDSQSPPSFF